MEEITVNLLFFFKKCEDVKFLKYSQVWQGEEKCNLLFEIELSREKSTWSVVNYRSRQF